MKSAPMDRSKVKIFSYLLRINGDNQIYFVGLPCICAFIIIIVD